MKPINIMSKFPGHRFTLDPAYDSRCEPWMFQMRCAGKGITIYPHSNKLLAVEVNYRPRIRKQLLALGLRCSQDGDNEATFLFTPEKFQDVAAIVKPRRKRVMSPEHKAKLRAKGVLFG